MLNNLTEGHLAELLSGLSGQYQTQFCNGRVKVLARDLPENAVAVACPPQDGVVFLIYDMRKPDALAHLRDLLRLLWTSSVEPVAFPDGTVELAARALPRVEMKPIDVSVTA